MIKKFLPVLFLLLASSFTGLAQALPGLRLEKDPWTKNQLIEPSELMAVLNNPKAAKPLIYNIGVVDNIPGAIAMGGASEKENLEKFRRTIVRLPKNTPVVIYCGCCPFAKCPNIRPAFNAMQAAGLTNGRLLHLPVNIRTDWIGKGYPLAK